jgi:hypothetical protein
MSFALLRVVLPYLGGFTDSGVANKDTATSEWFLRYLNANVLALAGIPTAGAKPTDAAPSLSYPVSPVPVAPR